VFKHLVGFLRMREILQLKMRVGKRQVIQEKINLLMAQKIRKRTL
jgi:hypothetical protein